MENYDNYIDKLYAICQNKNIKINSKRLNSDYDFLSIRINEKAKKSICFSAGIHGDETAGPEAVLKFIEQVEIPKDIFVMIFPLFNPWGFDRKIRTNAFQQDINRRFCDKLLAGEAKKSYDLLKKFPVQLFCSLHEWPGQKEFYMYASDKSKKKELLKVPEIAKKWYEIFDNKKINDELVENGIIWHPDKGYNTPRGKCTLENKMFTKKVHYVCLETPQKDKLENRSDCQVAIMKYLLNII